MDALRIGATLDHLLSIAPSMELKPWGRIGAATVLGHEARFEANLRGECVYSHFLESPGTKAIGKGSLLRTPENGMKRVGTKADEEGARGE